MQGYPHNEWFYQNENIGAMNKGEIQLLKHTRYGIISEKGMVPRRAHIVNLLCELDEPGEWYLDQTDKKLYIWPFSELRPTSSITLLGGPCMLELAELSAASVESIIFENGGALAIDIIEGESNLKSATTTLLLKRNTPGRSG